MNSSPLSPLQPQTSLPTATTTTDPSPAATTPSPPPPRNTSSSSTLSGLSAGVGVAAVSAPSSSSCEDVTPKQQPDRSTSPFRQKVRTSRRLRLQECICSKNRRRRGGTESVWWRARDGIECRSYEI
ncbi:hypothetical protein PMAA_096820 [Talaromyces marneffei ATCC 18224]|uniref:Uncharacterized protein n=1 Tax=Talaromyces marneffei (strain ATCC 18224 / CBS 334.59 / QM 7333) TaxID=441960 RepID=B6QI92_TALMQ|nr:hypothetical protein PMAA_096820 [Talaromyces marneffei ATCC 18224]